jgi:glycosyltransferase involved in cell wall biosynthesis
VKVGAIVASSEWHPSARYGSDRPLVSVLLPTYQRAAGGRFLRAVRSVLDQELRELELIVVDDGSTDDTAAQVRQLMAEDGRVHLVRHPSNVGLPAISEYEAFVRARGDFLAFAFDDDEFYPDALRRLREAAVAGGHPVVHGHVELAVPDERTGGVRRIRGFGREDIPQRQLQSNNFVANLSLLVHRRVFEAVGLYDSHVCIAPVCDWDLLRRIAEAFAIRRVDVAVGSQSGPVIENSIGRSYPIEWWCCLEWMSTPRNELLLPERFREYDVLSVPESLSAEGRLTVREMGAAFRAKAWYPRAPEPDRDALAPDVKTAPSGHVLVVVASCDEANGFLFGGFPQAFQQRIRLLDFGVWDAGLPEEMIGASAVVFSRSAFRFMHWIDFARRLQIPHYCLLDSSSGRGPDGDVHAEERAPERALRELLGSCDGLFVTTPGLLQELRARGLHSRITLWPFPTEHAIPSDPRVAALREMLERHPSPGLVLRDLRYRRALAAFKRRERALADLLDLSGGLPVPVRGHISYAVQPVRRSLSEVLTMIGGRGLAVSGRVRLVVRDAATRALLRSASIALERLEDWGWFRFEFETIENVAGRRLILQFVPETDQPIVLFERSTDARRFARRVLRKLGRDRHGRDLRCELLG